MSTPTNDGRPDTSSDGTTPDNAGPARDLEPESGGSTELDNDDADLAGSAFPPDNSFGQVPDSQG